MQVNVFIKSGPLKGGPLHLIRFFLKELGLRGQTQLLQQLVGPKELSLELLFDFPVFLGKAQELSEGVPSPVLLDPTVDLFWGMFVEHCSLPSLRPTTPDGKSQVY
jgi:hypothetical protein